MQTWNNNYCQLELKVLYWNLQIQSQSQQEVVHDDEIRRVEKSSISSMQFNNNRSEAEDSIPSTSSQNRNLPNNTKQV